MFISIVADLSLRMCEGLAINLTRSTLGDVRTAELSERYLTPKNQLRMADRHKHKSRGIAESKAEAL